jgi:VWFA-related protein
MHWRSLPAFALILQLTLLTMAQSPATQQRPQSQRPQPESTEDVVKITTNLVQIDAVITDKNGNQVRDLRPDEFQVFQDGRLQKVSHLSYITVQPDNQAKVSEAKPATPAQTVESLIPSHTLRPEEVRRTIALIVDDLDLSFVSTASVRKTLTKYVNEQMQPGDLVAIIRTSAGAGPLQQFTSNKRELLAAIDQIRWYSLGRTQVGVFAPIQPNRLAQLADTLGGSPNSERAAENAERMNQTTEAEREEMNQVREESFAVGTLGAVNYVVHGLEKFPGRKSVVLLSDGFKLFTKIKQGFALSSDSDSSRIRHINEPSVTPNERILDALHRLTDAANRASVVVYTMDVRGLQTLALTAEDNTAGTGPDRLEQQLLDRQYEFFETQAGLAYLARLTGGLAIQNENDLNQGLQRVLDDQSAYYLIGYRPDESTFDPTTGRPNFHKIIVKVNRPGMKVRSRSGFFGVPDAEAHERASAGNLAEALASPFGTADVHLRLTSLFGDEDQVGPLISSVLYIDGRDLSFKDSPDGWHEAEIEVAAYTFGAFGVVVDSVSRTHKVRVRAEVYDSIMREGLLYTLNVPIKKAGAYQLRVAVRDSASKRVGTASQFIEVPDLSKKRLALSGIFLSGIDPKKAKQNVETNPSPTTNDGADAQASPAVRRLRAGMELHYAYYVYNAKLGVARQPQLTTQVRLFHDGQLAYEGKVTPYDAAKEIDLKRLRAGGRITLSPKAPAGEYILQVVVTDSLTKGKQSTATQWIDFEITK